MCGPVPDRVFQQDETGDQAADRSRNRLVGTFLTALADYHNQVAVNFSGCYPLVSVSDKCVVLKNGLATGKSKAAVVLANGKREGCCVFSQTGKFGSIDYLYINEQLRGHGAGALLMCWMLKELGRTGVELLELKAVVGNGQAVRFYEHYGFASKAIVLAKKL